ncbi:MAG: response regulator transcription factor [Synergistaceae bacterium]|jgi:DNA-binding response OmpR family regulator|nr:response regulator transcription factor [Synergistaceae bacterium]
MGEDRHNILAVDDEPKIIEVLESFLESRGYSVFGAGDTERAFDIFEREKIDLILLDLMLPGMTGEEFCKAIRRKSRVPIIMLTAKVEEDDMLNGLSIGADDYIAKPFSLKALLARIEAVLRRYGEYLLAPDSKMVFNGGELEINFDSRSLLKNGRTVTPTPSEFKILEALAQNPNKVFTREQLIDTAMGNDFEGFSRAIDGHVKNLRQKIEDDHKKPRYILTMHGVGYKFGGKREEKI